MLIKCGTIPIIFSSINDLTSLLFKLQLRLLLALSLLSSLQTNILTYGESLDSIAKASLVGFKLTFKA